MGFAHYHRPFTAHRERTAMAWTDFEEKHAAGAGAAERETLVAAAVPDPRDRLDLAALDRPLDGLRHTSHEEFQDALRAYVENGLDRRHDPAHSADLGVVLGLLSVCGQLVRLGDLGSSWHGFLSHLASGPPGPRLRPLPALSRRSRHPTGRSRSSVPGGWKTIRRGDFRTSPGPGWPKGRMWCSPRPGATG